MVTLLVGADVCPIERNTPYFESGDAETLFGDVLPALRGADYVVANLECPLVDRPTPIAKTGPIFGESTRCSAGIRASGIRALGLANNHIMDHGPQGLASTLRACAEAGIATVGAGSTLAAAREPLIVEIRGLRLAIIALAEREFSIAGPSKPGAAPIDLIETVRSIREERSRYDYLVVLFHGSDEFFVPTPRVQNTCRFLVEMGANAVFVQHPHVVGGFENYRGGHIIYGQGALIMDEAVYRDRHSFHEGYLGRIEIADDCTSSFDLLPFEQSTTGIGTRLLKGDAEATFRRRLHERSALIVDPAVARREWAAFCARHRHEYLSTVLGHGRILGRLNRHGHLARLLYRRFALLRVRNVITCETHREALEQLFESDLLP